MTDGHSSHDSGSDPFLRAVASAPSRPPPSGDDRDPERIAHFRVLGRLGQGGMGIVYRAEDEKLRRTVALKVLPRAFAQDAERRRRFLREARSAAAIAHPNIAAVYDVDEADGRVFLAMELVEGETVRARIERGPLPVAEAIHVARGVARGLARAHAKGVVHRDLKPDNVILDADGEPKILDFGLAKLREAESEQALSAVGAAGSDTSPTEEGRLLGTPQYMSPEQAKGTPVDARSDVFALGLLLHEMCAGRRAFHGASRFDVLMAIARDAHAPLRSLVPDAPRELEAIVDRCLAKSPADRYAEAGEVAVALDALVSSGGARSDGPAGGPLPPARGLRAPIGMIAVGLATLTVAAVLLMRDRPAAPPHAAASAAVSAGTATPSGRPRAATDWPPPPTTNPEAAASYAAGLQALRDGSHGAAVRDFRRAVELDPHHAAAHVRLAFGLPTEEERTHAAVAAESRASLEPRDRELLELVQAACLDPADNETPAAKARAVANALPDDAEALFWAAWVLSGVHRESECLPILDRVMRLDPHFAGAEHLRALVLLGLGDVEGALAATERCLTLSPTAASCVRRRADVHSVRGECDALERDARQILAMEPLGSQGYGYLMTALAAQGAPFEALQQLARKEAALLAGADARRMELNEVARLAIHTGDFDAAQAALLTMEAEAANDSDESAHLALVWQLMLHAEEGADAKALAAADEFMRKLPAWVHDGPNPWRPYVLATLRRAGAMPYARVRETGEAWIRDVAAQVGERSKNDIWTVVWAAPAETAAEARAALQELPAWSPLPGHRMSPSDDAAVGRVYALAGDAARAIPLLRAEATWCGPVPTGAEPLLVGTGIRALQNRLLLGEALEQTGDRDGACAQYAAVLARWGHAKPRSVTGDKARARARALGCR